MILSSRPKRNNPQKRSSLRTQISLGFILLAIFTTLAIGIPALWLNQGQSERQAWAQVSQGVTATSALYTARANEVAHLAKLIAQRPTLHALLIEGDQQALLAYLLEFQSSATLDSIAICDQEQLLLVYTGEPPIESLCQVQENSQYLVTKSQPTAWLLSAYPLDGTGEMAQEADPAPKAILASKVVVGIELNAAFAADMRLQTGLEHSLYVADELLATSLATSLTGLLEEGNQTPGCPQQPHPPQIIEGVLGEGQAGYTFRVGNHSYYAARLPLGTAPLQAEVALDIGEIQATRQRLAIIFGGGILLVAILGLFSGILLARRISQPLVSLAKAAEGLSRENLDSAVPIDTPVEEVSAVAQALENARLDLKQTLTALQQERDWTNALLESIVEGVMTLDEAQRIRYFSAGAEHITGWNREAVLGQAVDAVFKLADLDPAVAASESVRFSSMLPPPGDKRVINVLLSNNRQTLLAVTEATFIPTQASDSQLALVFRDVSEEQAINRMLGQFLSNVAHEFRTPLSALAAALELLEDQFDKRSLPSADSHQADFKLNEVNELLNSLGLGILGLETLIDNLLESASIEARRFRVSPRPADISDIITEAVQTMTPLLEKHSQRLTVNLPKEIPVVRADPRRTLQVLINLLSNAIKYSPIDSQIDIDLQIRPGHARVTVSDRGPGISSAYQEDIFVRFVAPRVEDEKAKPGTGLGLSVVKAIVEAQGGRVGVGGRLGGGATFWFTIPLLEHAHG